jgi:hypothetical protein
MGYSYTFTFRLTADERQWLAALAQRLYRTESSADQEGDHVAHPRLRID